MSFRSALIASEHAAQSKDDYHTYHRRRFEYVVALCRRLAPEPATRVLDIGRSQLSLILRDHYRDVWTLGFPLTEEQKTGHGLSSADAVEGALSGHIVFNLNDSQLQDHFVPCGTTFDLIVFAETIEHLYAAPELVLHTLRDLLNPGGLLVCQTPNAAALHKRILLGLGRNPYERIRIDEGNPGHFREYTKSELVDVGRTAGFQVVSHQYVDYFGQHGSYLQKTAILGLKMTGVVAPFFRRGQTIVYRA